MSSPIPEASRVALDQTACIVAQSDIGQTITHNICTGATAVVPWGSADWLGFCALAGIGLFLGALLIGVLTLLAREVWSHW